MGKINVILVQKKKPPYILIYKMQEIAVLVMDFMWGK